MMMTNKKIILSLSMLSLLVLAGCSGKRVEMSFDDAHTQFNKQFFSTAVDANMMISALENISGYEKWELSADAQGYEVDANVNLDYEGKPGAMNFVLDMTANGLNQEEQVNFNATLDALLTMVEGETYFYINKGTVADESDENENPMLQLVQGLVDQVSNTWIKADSVQDQSGAVDMSSVQLAEQAFAGDGLQKAKKFLMEIQTLLNDNLLFVQKGEVNPSGKIMYPLAINVDGIKTILEGIVYNESADLFLSQDGRPLTQEEKDSLVQSVPELLSTLYIDAYLRVDSLDNVVLVINQLGFPSIDGHMSGGIVNSEIGPKKLIVSVENENGLPVLSIKNKGTDIILTIMNELGTAATVVFNGAIDLMDNSVLYNLDASLDADLGKFSPGVYDGEKLNLSLSIEKLVEATGAVDVVVPSDATSLVKILEAMGLGAQPMEVDDEFGNFGSNPYNVPADDSFARNETFMGE